MMSTTATMEPPINDPTVAGAPSKARSHLLLCWLWDSPTEDVAG